MESRSIAKSPSRGQENRRSWRRYYVKHRQLTLLPLMIFKLKLAEPKQPNVS